MDFNDIYLNLGEKNTKFRGFLYEFSTKNIIPEEIGFLGGYIMKDLDFYSIFCQLLFEHIRIDEKISRHFWSSSDQKLHI